MRAATLGAFPISMCDHLCFSIALPVSLKTSCILLSLNASTFIFISFLCLSGSLSLISVFFSLLLSLSPFLHVSLWNSISIGFSFSSHLLLSVYLLCVFFLSQ